MLFKPNWAQQILFKNMWNCMVVLKARQLGISTFFALYLLDVCLFSDDKSAAIVCQTREAAEQLFRKIKFAYDLLPEWLREERGAEINSARELSFRNGSSILVSNSLRSNTFQYLHISEFGKICAKTPEKAREIVTGSFNTISPGQHIFVESTAEGKEGYFFRMCSEAQELIKNRKKPGEMDFHFFFFPWWKHPDYLLKEAVEVPLDTAEYFTKIKEEEGIELSEDQKAWYVKKQKTQQDDMLREFPSTPEEAFKMSADGNYYGKLMQNAWDKGHIFYEDKVDPLDAFTYIPNFPVFTAWDLGISDKTAIWIYQYYDDRIFLLEYFEDSGKSLNEYLDILKQKDYHYWTHFVPHDAAHRDYGTGLSRVETARKKGFHFRVAPNPQKLSVQEGIDAVREILPKCRFNGTNCEKGIIALENYKREWNQKTGDWGHKPFHNEASHGADAFRVLATTLRMTKYEPYFDDPKEENYWAGNRQNLRLHDEYEI